MKNIILFGLATALSVSGLHAKDDEASLKDIEVARQVITEYVNTRQDIAKEKNEWKAYQKLTQDRIDLYRKEIEDLQSQLSTAEDQTTQAEREIAKITQSIKELRSATNVVAEALPAIEDKLRELYSYFPKPLQNKVEPLVKGLGKKNSRIAERMAIVIGIMNEADKFNSEFNLFEDEREADGKTKTVDVIYVGLATAYYADKEGKIGGVGTPTQNGWKWTENNDLAGAIHESVLYFNGDIKPAVMVNLPISITNVAK